MIGFRAAVRRLIPRLIRNWLRSPSRSFARAWDELGHLLGRHPVISPRPPWSFRVHPAAWRTFGTALKEPGQRQELDTFIASCHPGMMLLDIGAHYGLFSFAALHYGGPAARVVAVEASGSAVRILRLHARLNGVLDRLKAVHAAATAHSGWQVMLPVGVIANGYYIEPDREHPASDLVRVRAVTVDGLVGELGETPTHLKIDVEGTEGDVLRGAHRTLAGDQPPRVFLELHNVACRRAGRDPADCLLQLAQMGYRIEGTDGTPLSVEQATAPVLIRLVAWRPTLQFPAL